MLRGRLLSLLLLLGAVFAPTPSLAVDLLCTDSDNDGVFNTPKAVGQLDRDCDGELSVADGGFDCDDLDPLIRNGERTYQVYEVAKAVCAAGQYRTCSSGTLSSCGSAALADRATVLYGSVGGSGTTCSKASPCAWCSLSTGGSNVGKITSTTQIVLTGTTNVTAACPHTPDGGDSCDGVGIDLTTAGTSSASPNILQRDPGSSADIALTTGYAICAKKVTLHASNWIVRGFDLTAGLDDGIRIYTSSGIEIYNNRIHDIDGDANNNLSGIDAGGTSASNVVIHHNLITNIADSTRSLAGSDRQNVAAITLFEEDNRSVHHNFIGYDHAVGSTPYYKQGQGIRFKHGKNPAGSPIGQTVYDNVIWNTEIYGIGTGTSNADIYGNLILDAGACISSLDLGGGDGYFIENLRIRDNTCRVATSKWVGGALRFTNASTVTVPTTGVTVSNNVIVDADTSYGGGNYDAMVEVFSYGSNSLYTSLITGNKFAFSSNCYYDANIAGLTNGFQVFTDVGSGSSGSQVDFSNWKSTYSQDTSGSFNANPTLDANFAVTTTCSTTGGWVNQWPTTSTTTTTTTTVTTLTPNAGRSSVFPR